MTGFFNFLRHKLGFNMDNVERQCNIYGDDAKDMTPSRLFARFLSHYKFYNPSEDSLEGKKTCLDAAWAYYEHITLPRVYTDSVGIEMERAQTGEKSKRATTLYPFWKTSIKDLKTFGISVRMYFNTLGLLAIFLFLAGILNLPLSVYYWNFAPNTNKDGITGIIRASAICDDAEWVECESCNSEEYMNLYPSYRLDGENVLRNTCNFDDLFMQGVLSWISSIALVGAIGFSFYWIGRKATIVFDEEIQTAQDYSIKVVNPPRTALCPDEWKTYFDRFTDKGVACVTIVVDNISLLKKLIERRKLLNDLKKKLPAGTDLTDERVVLSALSEVTQHCWVRLFPGANDIYNKIKDIEENVRKIVWEYDARVVSVFVTFHSERGQRNVLHALSTGKLNIWRNKVNSNKLGSFRIKENAKSSSLRNLGDVFMKSETMEQVIDVSTNDFFFHQKVLNVKEAAEPYDIRWTDLEVSFKIRCLQFILSTFILIVFICWSAFFIKDLGGSSWCAVFIAITNAIIPNICDFINGLETHSTESKRQQSLYIKTVLFRCFNSAIALLLAMSFIQVISIEDGNEQEELSLIYSVYPVIFAEMFTIPCITLVDIVGNVRKHILAPRARDQNEMNSYFVGSKFELAERYTDATKILFVALLYSTILPESLFLGAIALAVHFLQGKFCLLRIWRSAPDIGTHLANLNTIFFSTTLVVHFFAAAYFWSGFPYDDVCNDGNGGYKYCNQNIFSYHIFPLPRFIDNTWMTESQTKMTSLYGWTALLTIVVSIFIFSKNTIIPVLKGFFYSTYEPNGTDMNIDFDEVKNIRAYVPQLKEKGFDYPIILCDICDINPNLLGWKDPFNGYEPHNITNDLSQILKEYQLPKDKKVFSIIKQYPALSSNSQMYHDKRPRLPVLT